MDAQASAPLPPQNPPVRTPIWADRVAKQPDVFERLSKWYPLGRVAEGGVVVTAVDPNGIAADHGFQVGDVILDISGKSVASPADVRRQIADARKQGKHTLLFRVKSNAGTRFVALPLGNA